MDARNLCEIILHTQDTKNLLLSLDSKDIKLLRDVIQIHILNNPNFEKKNINNKNKNLLFNIIKTLVFDIKFNENQWDNYNSNFYINVGRILNWLKINLIHIEAVSAATRVALSHITQEPATMKHIGRGSVWSLTDIDKMMGYDNNFVVMQDSTVVGYVGLHPYSDTSMGTRPSKNISKNISKGLQLRVFIGKKFIKKGYGVKAVKLLLEQTNTKEDIYAIVRRDNLPSNRLVKKSGFTFLQQSNVYGAPHNMYKIFRDVYRKTFFVPKTISTELDFSMLASKLEMRGLTNDEAKPLSFIWASGHNRRLMYSKHCILKNSLDGHNVVTDKLKLYINMLRNDISVAETNMAYTCELRLINDNVVPFSVLSQSRITLPNKYYIIRPVGGFSGRGISIIDSPTQAQLNSAYRKAKASAKGGPIIISDYVQDIMLYDNKKFHIRVYILCLLHEGVFSTFLWDNGKLMTAASEYNPNTIDKTISDTHASSTLGDLSVSVLKQALGSAKFIDIFNNIKRLMITTSQIMAPFIKNFTENKCGFEILAADLLLKSDGTPILMEVNERVGYECKTPEYANHFSSVYFDWVDGCVLSRVFPTSLNIQIIDPIFEVDMTKQVKPFYSKFFGFYGPDYEAAKTDLPFLIEYPYLRYYKSPSNIYSAFNMLKDHRYTISNEPYLLHNIKLSEEALKYGGKFTRIISTKAEIDNINSITDFFSEEVRVHCKFLNNLPIYNYYNQNINSIIDFLRRSNTPVSIEELREFLWSSRTGNRQCTTFKPKIIKYIIGMFGSRRVLDISAGWGDRLVGAMASDVDIYHGFDPNVSLQPKYAEIISFFQAVAVNPNIKCRVDPIPFETAQLDEGFYDLVMSSPPYFTMEIYTLESGQSTETATNEKDWYKSYLWAWIEKTKGALRNGGILALNIGQEQGKHYVNWLVEDLASPTSGFVYMGMLGYSNEDGKNPQAVFIWRRTRSITI